MRVVDFRFELPEDLIAQHPPAERGSSRMLVFDRATGALTDDHFRNLPNYLRPGDLLVLNDSRVLPARLFASRVVVHKEPGSPQPTGVFEVLLTERIEALYPDPISPPQYVWRALVRPSRKVKPGDTLRFLEHDNPTEPRPAHQYDPQFDPRLNQFSATRQPLLTAEVLSSADYGERVLRFSRVSDFYATLERLGHMPLPPYIRRRIMKGPIADADTAQDRERYQTVFSHASASRPPASAAAPTAGLHFTPEVLADIAARGIEIAYLTLHVGLGTFQPVHVGAIADIRLHPERYTLPAATAEALNRALAEGRRIIAVGTTTTRTLEHIAAEPGPIEPHSGSTSIFIAPGHRFRIVNGLLTNFHIPESTLMMLTSAFAVPPSVEDSDRAELGRQIILAAYAHAIRERYRFYSYGDCMLLL